MLKLMVVQTSVFHDESLPGSGTVNISIETSAHVSYVDVY